jgi:hypothetical protein
MAGAGTGASTDATSGSSATQTTDAQGKSGSQTATADGKAAADQQGDDQQQLGEAGKQALDSEREARKQAEKDAKDLRAQLKQLQEKDLPEAERTAREHAETKAENENLRKENQRLQGQLAVYGEASRLGFADPMDAFRLIDVEFDDDGKPKGVTQALNKLLEAKPYLKSGQARATTGGSADAGNQTGQPSGGSNMNDLIRQAAGRA